MQVLLNPTPCHHVRRRLRLQELRAHLARCPPLACHRSLSRRGHRLRAPNLPGAAQLRLGRRHLMLPLRRRRRRHFLLRLLLRSALLLSVLLPSLLLLPRSLHRLQHMMVCKGALGGEVP